MRPEGLGKLGKIHLIGTQTRDLPACSIVPWPLRYRVPPKFVSSFHKHTRNKLWTLFSKKQSFCNSLQALVVSINKTVKGETHSCLWKMAKVNTRLWNLVAVRKTFVSDDFSFLGTCFNNFIHFFVFVAHCFFSAERKSHRDLLQCYCVRPNLCLMVHHLLAITARYGCGFRSFSVVLLQIVICSASRNWAAHSRIIGLQVWGFFYSYGVRLSLLVLRPLLAYCTSSRW
jgi:hypothetical protein